MKSPIFWVFMVYGLLCLCLTQSTNSQSENSPCILQSGAAGVCKASVHDCDLHELAKAGKPISCGTEPGGNMLICCPKKASIRSHRKHKKYTQNQCTNIKPRIDSIDIICNREQVKHVEEFPHLALLGYNTGRGAEWFCGGTLISEQFILTAAHCLTNSPSPVSVVKLGFLDRNNRAVVTLQEFRVIDTVRHPNRINREVGYNAALLKLHRPVEITDTVFPACLHEVSTNKNRTIGWDLTKDVDRPCSMRSGAPGICKSNIEQCSDLWPVLQEGITECGTPGNNMICCPTSQSTGVDSSCTTQSGAAGVCKANVHDCDIHELAEAGKPTLCGTGPGGNMLVCCPNKTTISSQKCKEYTQKKCKDKEPQHAFLGLFNGKIVQHIEKFPHLALLGYDTSNKVEWFCGGTLISEQYILTAAHCVIYKKAPVSLVKLGLLHRNDTTENTIQTFRVIDIVRHPNRTAKVWYNDAALLKLDRPVELTDAVFPACLHEDFDIPGIEVLALGWGLTEDSQLSEELREASLTLVSNNACSLDHESNSRLPNGILDESQFCAGTNDKDTCKGDSGGPALIRRNKCMHSVVGITSFGYPCDSYEGTSPSVFTRVSHIIPWIESVVWPNQ